MPPAVAPAPIPNESTPAVPATRPPTTSTVPRVATLAATKPTTPKPTKMPAAMGASRSVGGGRFMPPARRAVPAWGREARGQRRQAVPTRRPAEQGAPRGGFAAPWPGVGPAQPAREAHQCGRAGHGGTAARGCRRPVHLRWWDGRGAPVPAPLATSTWRLRRLVWLAGAPPVSGRGLRALRVVAVAASVRGEARKPARRPVGCLCRARWAAGWRRLVVGGVR